MAQTLATEAETLIGGVLADHVINSQETFEWVTASPREVAGLYFYQQLDELIDLARAISFDFFARPNLYDALEDAEIASRIAALHARYGHDEKFLSREQRQKIYEGIFAAVLGGTRCPALHCGQVRRACVRHRRGYAAPGGARRGQDI
jgi:hypothetical protein